VGQPVDKDLDVGAAIIAGKDVEVEVFSRSSVLDPGSPTGKIEVIGRLLSPLAESEVGTIRCIGLNVSRSVILGSKQANRRSTSNMLKKPR